MKFTQEDLERHNFSGIIKSLLRERGIEVVYPVEVSAMTKKGGYSYQSKYFACGVQITRGEYRHRIFKRVMIKDGELDFDKVLEITKQFIAIDQTQKLIEETAEKNEKEWNKKQAKLRLKFGFLEDDTDFTLTKDFNRAIIQVCIPVDKTQELLDFIRTLSEK